MRHIVFTENQSTYPVSILIKPNNLVKRDLLKHYVEPLLSMGMSKDDFIAWDLDFNDKGKAPVSMINACLDNLLKAIDQVGSKYILVADGGYFKKLTDTKKTDPNYGYALDCVKPGYEHLKVVLIPNFAGLFYNPAIQTKIDLGLQAICTTALGMPTQIGSKVLENVIYIRHEDEDYEARVKETLETLLQYPELGVDIEAFSLEFYRAGIATIAFSIDKHSSVAIQVDYDQWPFRDDDDIYYGEQWDNVAVKALLKQFFIRYEGKAVYHNIGYDGKVLVYELFMGKDFFNYPGMMRGIETICRNFDDTKLITYLATNSCTGNTLGLKPNTHEFTGNYAQDSEDIKDIRRIDLDPLLEYNAIDTCATLYLKEKYWDQMVEDGQLEIYNTIFKPSVKVIMQMELTGLPINMDRVHEVNAELCAIRDDLQAKVQKSSYVQKAWLLLRQKEHDKMHEKWKKKTAPIENFNYVTFNPGSDKQLQLLLHDVMGLEVLDKTPTGAPATGGDTLKKHLAHTSVPAEKDLLQQLIGLAEVSILISTFMNAFLNRSIKKSDGWYYLHGIFNLGGTVSGRLSSKEPNLQNIPSTGNPYAKIVKSCIEAPPGWLLIGADFASLEDRISALTTKDPNKLKVYTDLYDGHCLRAFYYFGSQMPDIVETPDSINTIADKYPDLRQESKAPTFLLTYGGTHYGMMKNLGWSKDKAIAIETNYHNLYHVSDQWVQKHIKEACQTGYVTVAFGLRVRTPVLKQVIYADDMPYAAQSESRTAGNALGQSYGMLNNRAGIEFRERTLRSKYAYQVLPVAHIHDAQYMMVPEDVAIVKWVNDNLIPCMEWQELPEIQHDEVKLGGDLEIYYPNWSSKISIPNYASTDQIIQICKDSQ